MDPVRFDEWKRVVDHMKRLFAIVCGLALTLSCINAYTCFNQPTADQVGILQFVILLISIVPVFHGAERSLDLKYLRAEAPGGHPGWIILDFWLLLVSALFFILIAQGVPDYRQGTPPDVDLLRDRFLHILGIFFLFDVAVLLQGALRIHASAAAGDQVTSDGIIRRAHVLWMIGNGAMGAACLISRSYLGPGTDVVGLFWLILALAIARTIWDYGWGWRFLFPPPPT